jgi:hypothetical protein
MILVTQLLVKLGRGIRIGSCAPLLPSLSYSWKGAGWPRRPVESVVISMVGISFAVMFSEFASFASPPSAKEQKGLEAPDAGHLKAM